MNQATPLTETLSVLEEKLLERTEDLLQQFLPDAEEIRRKGFVRHDSLWRVDVKAFLKRIRELTGLSASELATSVGWTKRQNWHEAEKNGSIKPGRLGAIERKYHKFASFPSPDERFQRAVLETISWLRSRAEGHAENLELHIDQLQWLTAVPNRRFWVAAQEGDVAKIETILDEIHDQVVAAIDEMVFLDLTEPDRDSPERLSLDEIIQLMWEWYPYCVTCFDFLDEGEQ